MPEVPQGSASCDTVDRSLRIIVVDDEPTVLDMLATFFRRRGFDVATATDGDEAIKLVHRGSVDLVVTDILMPGKEGFETIRELRRAHPDLKIVAMTGGGRNVPDNYLQFAESFGANRTFSKPLNLNDLLSAVNDLLSVAPC